jgi:hypothetical protein
MHSVFIWLLNILEVYFLQETNLFVYGSFNDIVTERTGLDATLYS